MSYNGSGTFALPAGNPVTTNTAISSSVHNTTLSEIATGLSTAITKDGQTTITANLPMAGYRHTGVGNPTARTQYATAAGCQDNTYAYLSSVAGTNTITATAALSMSAYATGQAFVFTPANSNTGATTINVNSIGAKNVYVRGAACAGGELIANVPVQIVYDGTQFHAITFSGFVQKVEATPYATYASASTALPNDDSIPQSGEGTEVVTVAITPKSTLHRLVIEAVVHMSGDASRTCIAALFQDSTADALAVAAETSPAAGNVMTVRLRHEMAAGTVSATTFKIRAGTTTGTYYINGTSSSRSFGGILACTLSVSEFA